MKTCGALAFGMVAFSVSLWGCGSSRSTMISMGSEGTSASGVVILASTEGNPGLVSLGAGDRLGQRIHMFDVYLAAKELMGPEPVLPMPADRDDLIAGWTDLGPITGDVSLGLVAWE